MSKSKLEQAARRAVRKAFEPDALLYDFDVENDIEQRVEGGKSVLRAAERMSFEISIYHPDQNGVVGSTTIEAVVKLSDLRKWVEGE